jgi:hypothetical protein
MLSMALVLALGCNKKSSSDDGEPAVERASAGGAAAGESSHTQPAPSGEQPHTDTEAQPAAPVDVAKAARANWPAVARVAQQVTVDDVTVTLEVPDGLPRNPRDATMWDDDRVDLAHIPKVYLQTIEISRIKSLDLAKYHGTLDARTKKWVREEQRPDGWAVTYAEPDKTRIEAIVYRAAGDQYIKCKAVQASDRGLPDYDKTRAMLEAICDSAKPK